MIPLLLLSISARAEDDTGIGLIADPLSEEVSEEVSEADPSGGFLSSRQERESLISGIALVLSAVLGTGAIGGAAAYRSKRGMPASSVDQVNDPRLGELVSAIALLNDRLSALDERIDRLDLNDPRINLLIEQQHQIDQCLNVSATLVELLHSSLAMAPKLASARPEEVSV